MRAVVRFFLLPWHPAHSVTLGYTPRTSGPEIPKKSQKGLAQPFSRECPKNVKNIPKGPKKSQKCVQINVQEVFRHFLVLRAGKFGKIFLRPSSPEVLGTSQSQCPTIARSAIPFYCDAPYTAIGFRGTFFLRCPPSQACLWLATGHLYGKKWGCSSESLRYHKKTLCDRGITTSVSQKGGYFSRVTMFCIWRFQSTQVAIGFRESQIVDQKSLPIAKNHGSIT